MSALFYKLPSNFAKCFKGVNLIWQGLAFSASFLLVVSGFDWFYFNFFRHSFIYPYLFPAAIVGGLLPIFVPLVMLAVGKIQKSFRTVQNAWALAQAGLLGLFLSFIYKFFTGRVPPPLRLPNAVLDISHDFRFGLDQGGVFWGWPSSHTSVAFAMALTLWTLYPQNKLVRSLAMIYAVYVGLGVSVSIHWFSDFVAGVIFGTIVGSVVGRSFLEKIRQA